MIDWSGLASRLDRLARAARPAELVSVSMPLAALATLPGPPADADGWLHWQRPDEDFALTGLGHALWLETAGPGRFAALGAAMRGLRAGWRHEPEAPAPLACCGFAFSPEGGGPLPNACLSVPALLLRRQGEAVTATFSCVAAQAAEAVAHWQTLWRRLAAPGVPHGAPSARRTLTRLPTPLADQAFLARGSAALKAIANGELDKLVLTRNIRLRADRPLAPAPLLAALAARNAGCAVWAVAHRGRVFLGASPERLLRLTGRELEVDALAGTAWLGHADEATCLPLAAAKNRREHELVADSVAAALAPLCEQVTVPEAPEILRLHDLQHLRRRIGGRTRAGVDALELIARLHPTPAVGGTPTAAALDWLGRHGDRRGAWYTGAIGWLGADGGADFAVALRCGLISGLEATLFAGAGFVAGSEPRQELAETEAKLSPMLAALRSFGTTAEPAKRQAEGR